MSSGQVTFWLFPAFSIITRVFHGLCYQQSAVMICAEPPARLERPHIQPNLRVQVMPRNLRKASKAKLISAAGASELVLCPFTQFFPFLLPPLGHQLRSRLFCVLQQHPPGAGRLSLSVTPQLGQEWPSGALGVCPHCAGDMRSSHISSRSCSMLGRVRVIITHLEQQHRFSQSTLFSSP